MNYYGLQKLEKRNANLGKKEEYDFQSYDIILFKCPVFNNKNNQKAYKETEKYHPLNGTKLNDRNNPQESPDIRLTSQKLFKDCQSNKGKHGHITKEIRRIIHKQNENINIDIDAIKRTNQKFCS